MQRVGGRRWNLLLDNGVIVQLPEKNWQKELGTLESLIVDKGILERDVTQIDLPTGKRSGLMDAVEILKGVEGISFVQFNERDVVRHTLVQRIVRAYEKYNESIGAARQLTLKLVAEPEAPVSEAAALSAPPADSQSAPAPKRA